MEIYEFKSPSKTIVVLDGNFIRISRKGLLNVMNHGLDGQKSINIDNITAVQLKEPGFTNGYIQFTLVGGKESTGGVFAVTQDENTIMFVKKDLNKAIAIKSYIENILTNKNRNNIPIQATSSADELIKFKQLLDSGVITEQEFELKKKQLMNM